MKSSRHILQKFDPGGFPTYHLEGESGEFGSDKEFDEYMDWLFEDDLAFKQTPWVIGKFLRGWQMNVPEDNKLNADPKAFLEGVRQKIHQKLAEEIEDLNGVKFQLALKVQLRKDKPDGSEELTDPVLRHTQEAALKPHEVDDALDKAFPHIQETLEKWTQ